MAITQLKFSAMIYSIIILLICYQWIINEENIFFNRLNRLFILIGNYSFGIYLTHIAIMNVLNKTVYKFLDIMFPFNVVLIIFINIVGINFMVRFCGNRVCKYLGLI